MSPRADSPTNSNDVVMEEEEVAFEAARTLRRVPTPMGQSHTTTTTDSLMISNRHQEEDCLFDNAELPEKGTPVRSQKRGSGDFFGADFEAKLNDLKKHAQGAARNGSLSLQQILHSMTTPQNARERSSTNPDGDDAQSVHSSSRARTLIDVLTKPFVACSAHLPREFDEAVGEFVGETSNVMLGQVPSEDFTRDCSYIDDYDEAQQIHRMTSWNTLETAATYQTNASYISQATDTQTATMLYDDDGNPIPNVLVDLTKEMRQQRTRRRRVVKFDYPPISSLKECPRPDPDDLPDLYFTEDELNQIEDDRAGTATADDVEVVCVSASDSSESQQKQPPYESRPLREMGEVDESETSSLLQQHDNEMVDPYGESSSQQQQQKQHRRYRGRNPAPRHKKLFGRGGGRPSTPAAGYLPPKHPLASSSSADPATQDVGAANDKSRCDGCTGESVDPSSDDTQNNNNNNNGKRLIKSVHIFMRERSRERSAEI